MVIIIKRILINFENMARLNNNNNNNVTPAKAEIPISMTEYQ